MNPRRGRVEPDAAGRSSVGVELSAEGFSLDITDANVNDAQVGRTVGLEAGATYVFDKGYCHYGWWTAIAEAGSVFVTRPKSNMRLAVVAERPIGVAEGDGFTILEDAEVKLSSKGDSKLPVRLRRIVVRRHEGRRPDRPSPC